MQTGDRKTFLEECDPGQLPPVADKPLYHAQPTNAVGEQGYHAYLMFNKVVKLSVNQWVQGEGAQEEEFRDLQLRLRVGESTEQDWEPLMTRQPENIANINSFDDAARLFYNNKQV